MDSKQTQLKIDQQKKLQDAQLDEILNSLQRTKHTAQQISNELDKQGHIINEIEKKTDESQGFLKGTMRKLNQLIRKA